MNAIETLRNMRTIAENEMMVQGIYISDDVDDALRDEGAICGGHQACAIGSLWLAYGIKPVSGDIGVFLPDVSEGARFRILDREPELGIALDALNVEATKFMNEHDVEGNRSFTEPIESLFESEHWDDQQALTADMITVINNAMEALS